MSARPEALRFPGQRSDRSQWLVVLLALLVAVTVAVTATVLSRVDSGTADRVLPNTVSHANDGAAVAPASSVLQVGGTSVYRYHPLPGANTVFELAGPATATVAKAGTPTVGGSGAYRYHTLP
jgi:hypothetical protein